MEQSPKQPKLSPARATRVLIVEDEDVFRSQLEMMLRSEGYEVTSVATGREARDIFVIDPFDLVITDISMPNGDIDGNQLLDFIKGSFEAKVILMTGYKYPDDFEKISAFSPDSLLLKPFRREELQHAVTRCLSQPPGVRKVLLRPSEISALYEFQGDASETTTPCELLIDARDGTYEILCTEREPLPVEKIRAMRRLGIQILTRPRTADK